MVVWMVSFQLLDHVAEVGSSWIVDLIGWLLARAYSRRESIFQQPRLTAH
jgi:hypothetical protein